MVGISHGDRPPQFSEQTVAELGEFGLIDRLARLLGPAHKDPLRPPAHGEIAIGDDAALWVPAPGASEVLTTDALVEDVHFRLRTTSWHNLGWKALAQNVSDIAAMAALPRRAFVTLALRPTTLVADLESLYAGMRELADRYGMEIAGGDTVSSPTIMLSIAVVGELTGHGLRRGAGAAGDVLAVTGSLGGSAGGLELLEAEGSAASLAAPRPDDCDRPPAGGASCGAPDSLADAGDPDVRALIAAHRRPAPRVAEAQVIATAGARCGMDLSDGLLGDAGKLAYACGLAATIDWDLLPIDPALARRFGERARGMALGGGEDFELLVAAPAAVIERAQSMLEDERLAPLTVVGELREGRPGEVLVRDLEGRPVDAPATSWDHFAARPDA